MKNDNIGLKRKLQERNEDDKRRDDLLQELLDWKRRQEAKEEE